VPEAYLAGRESIEANLSERRKDVDAQEPGVDLTGSGCASAAETRFAFLVPWVLTRPAV
jgi:hypothetical protein